MNNNDQKEGLTKEVFNRIKHLSAIQKDVELADVLGMSTRNIINYKERGSLPWDYIAAYCKKNNYSLDYIINGTGSPTTGRIEDAAGVYTVRTNQDDVYDIAAMIHDELQAQGKQASRDKFRQLIKLLHRGMLETGKPPTADKIKEMILLL